MNREDDEVKILTAQVLAPFTHGSECACARVRHRIHGGRASLHHLFLLSAQGVAATIHQIAQLVAATPFYPH